MSQVILFIALCSGTDAASTGKRFLCFTSVHAKPFLLLLVRQVGEAIQYFSLGEIKKLGLVRKQDGIVSAGK